MDELQDYQSIPKAAVDSDFKVSVKDAAPAKASKKEMVYNPQSNRKSESQQQIDNLSREIHDLAKWFSSAEKAPDPSWVLLGLSSVQNPVCDTDLSLNSLTSAKMHPALLGAIHTLRPQTISSPIPDTITMFGKEMPLHEAALHAGHRTWLSEEHAAVIVNDEWDDTDHLAHFYLPDFLRESLGVEERLCPLSSSLPSLAI